MKRSDVALALGAALPFLLGKSSKQGGFNKWDDLEGDKPTTWFDYAFRDESFPGERLQPDFQNWNQFKMLKRYFKEGVDVFTDIIGTVLGKVKPAPQVKTMFIASAMQNIPFPEFEQVYKDKHPKASEQDAKFAYKAASIQREMKPYIVCSSVISLGLCQGRTFSSLVKICNECLRTPHWTG